MLILIQLQYCQFYLLQVSLTIKLYHIKVFCSIEIHGNFTIGLKRGREENSFTRNTPCELKCSACSYSQTERAFLFCFKTYSTKQHFILFYFSQKCRKLHKISGHSLAVQINQPSYLVPQTRDRYSKQVSWDLLFNTDLPIASPIKFT